jgi:MFS family permease
MLIQGLSLGAIALGDSFGQWVVAAVGLGLGTAMVYPTLLASVADAAEPAWRGSAVGIYRMWRDLGFAAGAIVGGIVADASGLPFAIGVVGALTIGSGLVVAIRMRDR